jgi:hypothetical protein
LNIFFKALWHLVKIQAFGLFLQNPQGLIHMFGSFGL